jgi:hypothetical protein
MPAMPARMVVVHDDPRLLVTMVDPLIAAAFDVVGFLDPVRALAALEWPRRIERLMTRLMFVGRQPVGLSLARLARSTSPDVKVIFVDQKEMRRYSRGQGEFMPVTEAVDLVTLVQTILG